jgi:glycosyltransferase involved in cell wall biosynthesis
MLPKVSIIIPTYNRAHYLIQAIESSLAQNYSNLEVVVSDNASTDETENVIKKFLLNKNFKYYKNNYNIGMVNNWGKAISDYISGEWFIILSDDDYLIDNNYISNAVNIILNNEDIVIVYAQGYILNETTKKITLFILNYKEIEKGKKIFLNENKDYPQYFMLCNVLFNRKLALELYPFSNKYNLSCDSELFLKMCLFGQVGIIKDFVSVYRAHSNNLNKKISQDINLLKNKPEYLFQAYKFAFGTKLFTQDELNKWKNRMLLHELKHTLVDTFIYYRKEFVNLTKFFKEKDEDLFLMVINNYGFKIRIFLGKISRNLLILMRSLKMKYSL